MTSDIAGTGQPTIGTIVVAAGRGERLGASRPKAFVKLNGIPLLSYSVHTITRLPYTGHLVLVVPESLIDETRQLASSVAEQKSWTISVVSGGAERDESVRRGLAALPQSVDTVLVHDAARPLTPSSLFTRVIESVRVGGDSVIPALPVTDTIKRVHPDGTVHETVDRSELAAVQTPQGFLRHTLQRAHEQQLARVTAPHDDAMSLPTDDAEVVQRAGATVRTALGDALALKVTTPADLTLLTAVLNSQPSHLAHTLYPQEHS